MNLTVKEAADYITQYLKKEHNIDRTINPSNISYLVQYGRVTKYKPNQKIYVDIDELVDYYKKNVVDKHNELKEKFGDDFNLKLAFSDVKESDRTKHVHRLHPYKGKFIPQLVEYFIDDNVDEFKKEVFFSEGDTILDPFLGSGTTIIEAKEKNINSIGIDISEFNCLMSEVKSHDYSVNYLESKVNELLLDIEHYISENVSHYENELKEMISQFNEKYFPSPEFKRKVQNKEVDEKEYSSQVLDKFRVQLNELKKKYKINDYTDSESNNFMDRWLMPRVKNEALKIKSLIENLDVEDEMIKNLFLVVLTKTIRSCRTTKHSDLSTLKEPQYEPYYCVKHYKICTPVTSCLPKFKFNLNDTLKRISEYDSLKYNADSLVIHGDSSEVDILRNLKENNSDFYNKVKVNKIDGIFTSPPYLGVIDYHEQHAYAYELLNIERKDDEEIGKLSSGKSKEAQEKYIEDISNVFLNCKKYLKNGADIFVVANDDLNLYPSIFEKADLQIINKFKRPVLNRTERNRNKKYAETIFHCRER